MSKEKYSVVETENANYIADNEEDVVLNVAFVVKMLNDYEHRLSNCIEPKFKVGQEVWLVLCDGIKKDVVENNYHLYSLEKSRLGLYESCLYATEEEAKAKLREIQDGNNN